MSYQIASHRENFVLVEGTLAFLSYHVLVTFSHLAKLGKSVT